MDLDEEGTSQAQVFKLIVLCRFVQLILCEPVKLG
jgi:hypothetical protein